MQDIPVYVATSSTASVVSYPKCGRTWLRHLYYYYTLAAVGRRELSRKPYSNHPDQKKFFRRLLQTHAANHRYPIVDFSHGGVRQKGMPYWSMVDRSAQFVGKPVVLLARDPRDIVVSSYHERRRVQGDTGTSLSDFIRDDHFGIRHALRFLDIWGTAFGRNASEWSLVYYEDLRSAPTAVFEEILRFWGIDAVDQSALSFAVEESRLEKLQAREKLRRGAASVELRIRRGKVGGYRTELNRRDRLFLASIIQRDLHQVFRRYAPRAPLRWGCALAIQAHALQAGVRKMVGGKRRNRWRNL